ncbi:hypothetical protein HS088_TW18G00481 [Tripterygium wilfordii]|uniref:Uncharacterized protein n=2 Tax=Tripterygium wilfordii TaxID=458696 RepID=A0A7J7CDI3_TRIWF|nr:hypothetical protein HS088_TW18G00481 [Tripterygium wilfordii]
MKKLKFWSKKKRKKRRKTQDEPYYYPPSTSFHHCCCPHSSSSTQPSAPPLPSWLEPLAPPPLFPEVAYSGQARLSSQEIASETNYHRESATDADAANLQSYQQYLVPNPVYGVPAVVHRPRRERSAGFFGCIVEFGVNVVRCFCPCFRLQEVP